MAKLTQAQQDAVLADVKAALAAAEGNTIKCATGDEETALRVVRVSGSGKGTQVRVAPDTTGWVSVESGGKTAWYGPKCKASKGL